MSKTQVNDYLSSVKAADRPNECEYCRKAFTPRVYAPRDPGYLVQRFCSKRCTDDMAHLNNQNALIEKGLLGVLDLSKRLDVSPYRVHQLITQGLLRAERVSFPGQRRPVWGASEEDVERFEREWARGEGSDTGYRRQWQTEDFALKQARSRNLRPELRELEPRDVEAVVRARVKARATRLGLLRRGRKKASERPAHYLRWEQRYDELAVELPGAWEVQRSLIGAAAGARPTVTAIRLQVALEDRAESPERWPRNGWRADPADPEMLHRDLHSDAAEKIRTALKRLEIERSENPGG